MSDQRVPASDEVLDEVSREDLAEWRAEIAASELAWSVTLLDGLED